MSDELDINPDSLSKAAIAHSIARSQLLVNFGAAHTEGSAAKLIAMLDPHLKKGADQKIERFIKIFLIHAWKKGYEERSKHDLLNET